MLDSIRHLRLSKEEKRQEAITAYLDGLLTPKERARFEKQMAAEPALKAEVEAQRQLKLQLSQLPRQAAPRNYTLDPAAYGEPDQGNVFALYPILRGATVMAGLLFIVALTAQLLFGSQNLVSRSGLASEAEMNQELAEDSFAAEAEQAPGEAAAEEIAEGIPIEEAPVAVIESPVVVEEVVEEEAAEELEAAAPVAEAEEPSEEEPAAALVVTAELEAELPAESPAMGESEADRAPAASDGGLETLEMSPTAPATQETELALPATSPALKQDTRQPEATARTQTQEAAPQPLEDDTAKASDEARFDPLRSLPILVVVLGVIVLVLVLITLLVRRRI